MQYLIWLLRGGFPLSFLDFLSLDLFNQVYGQYRGLADKLNSDEDVEDHVANTPQYWSLKLY